MKHYTTMRAAHNALCLDAGFDPFLHGGMRGDDGRTYRKLTKGALRACGYPVSAPALEKKYTDYTDMTTARVGETRNGWTREA